MLPNMFLEGFTPKPPLKASLRVSFRVRAKGSLATSQALPAHRQLLQQLCSTLATLERALSVLAILHIDSALFVGPKNMILVDAPSAKAVPLASTLLAMFSLWLVQVMSMGEMARQFHHVFLLPFAGNGLGVGPHDVMAVTT